MWTAARAGDHLGRAQDSTPGTVTQTEIAADLRPPNLVLALIAGLGEEASWRYVEFFTANMRNPHRRRAHALKGFPFRTLAAREQ